MREDVLTQLHKIEIEILNEFCRVCNLLNLKYYLIGGTLLGAVRHKGFIPWDDDLDIAMPRRDYKKLIKYAPEILNKNYKLQVTKYDKNYWRGVAKIRKNNTLFLENYVRKLNINHGIFIDIFPLDHAFSNKRMIKFQKKIYLKLQAITDKKYGLWIKSDIILKVLIAKILPNKVIKNLQNFFMQLCIKSNTYVNFGSNYDVIKQTIPKDKYDPPILLEFEGKMYSAPNDYDYILKRIYGDNYMQLPPKEKRVTHNPIRLSFNTNGPDEEL